MFGGMLHLREASLLALQVNGLLSHVGLFDEQHWSTSLQDLYVHAMQLFSTFGCG